MSSSATAAHRSRSKHRRRLLRRATSKRASSLPPDAAEAALRFFSGGEEAISAPCLTQRLLCFHANASQREIKVLLNHKPALSTAEVAAMLGEAPPSKRLNREAFELLDAAGSGVADEAVLLDALSFVVEGDALTPDELRDALEELVGAPELTYEAFKTL